MWYPYVRNFHVTVGYYLYAILYLMFDVEAIPFSLGYSRKAIGCTRSVLYIVFRNNIGSGLSLCLKRKEH